MRHHVEIGDAEYYGQGRELHACSTTARSENHLGVRRGAGDLPASIRATTLKVDQPQSRARDR